jgi:hypothetical protein
VNPTVLTQKEQELFDKYKPLFAAQRFTLEVSNLGGSSNHWRIEDSIFPDFEGHRFYKVYDSTKLVDFELWLQFYLDFATSYRLSDSLNIYSKSKVLWNGSDLDYTKSNYSLKLLLESSDSSFYEIECKLNFEVGSSSLYGEVVANKLYGSNVNITLLDGTPLTIEDRHISLLLTRPFRTEKVSLKEIIVCAIEKLSKSAEEYITEG